ncbi:FtsX-like permease family protein [Microbacterium sp. bgisy189]|uniref:FtsX-like permease family protein n=1 Tax=Microbacterium sp. bgisy189 TaxID=3413798 RepID=UPI003EB77A90
MIGWPRFAWARARDAAAPLLALAVVVAVSVAVLLGSVITVRAIEAVEVRAALQAAGGSISAVLTPNEAVDQEMLAAAAADSIAARGAGDALVVTVEDGAIAVTTAPGITGEGVGAARAALAEIGSDVGDAVDARVQVSGPLRDLLATIEADIEQGRGPAAISLALLIVIVGVVVAAVAVEPARARRLELQLLRARGARARSLGGSAALEAAAVAFVAGAIGVLVALGIGALLGVRAGWLLPVAAIAGSTVVASIVAAISTRRVADSRTTRARVAALISAVVLGAVVTGVAAWQFAQTGDPYVVRSDGSLVLDPIVAVAPALVLLLVAAMALLLTTPVERLVAAATAGVRGIHPVTPLRLASRRPARHGLSLILVAFTVGALTVGITYQGSVGALGRTPEDVRVGTDVRVSTIPADVSLAELIATADADAAMTARSVLSRTRDQRVTVLAAQSATLGEVMSDIGGLIDPERIGELVAVEQFGVPLTGADLELALTVPSLGVWDFGEGNDPIEVYAPVFVTPTLIDEHGSIWTGYAANAEQAGRGGGIVEYPTSERLEASLTPPEGTWRLAAIQVGFLDFAADDDVRVAASSGGSTLDLAGFAPSATTTADVAVDGATLVLRETAIVFDAAPMHVVAPGAVSVLPAVVTERLAADLGLEVGDTFTLPLTQPTLDADFELAGITALLPGTPTGQGVVVDLPALMVAGADQAPPNEVWLATQQPAATAVAVESAFPGVRPIVADPRADAKASGAALSLLLAAGAAALLAVTVLLLRRSRRRDDSRELAMLALLGLGRRGAARVRAREDLATVVLGVVSGVLAGIVTAVLVVPSLVRIAYGRLPDDVTVSLVVPPVPMIVMVVVVVALFGAIALSVRAPTDLAHALREDE